MVRLSEFLEGREFASCFEGETIMAFFGDVVKLFFIATFHVHNADLLGT